MVHLRLCPCNSCAAKRQKGRSVSTLQRMRKELLLQRIADRRAEEALVELGSWPQYTATIGEQDAILDKFA